LWVTIARRCLTREGQLLRIAQPTSLELDNVLGVEAAPPKSLGKQWPNVLVDE